MSRIYSFAKRLLDCVGVLAAIPIVLLCRFLRPVVNVRFGFFFVDRIGHFAFDLEYYLSRRASESFDRPVKDLFFTTGDPCNDTLITLMERHVVVHPLVRYLFHAERIIPFNTKELLPARLETGSMDPSGILAKNRQQLTFLEEEDEKGLEYLYRLGCGANEKIVCLIVRDSAYLNSIRREKDWEYHSYRDTDISNYKEAALYLAQKGYWVFRMGKFVNQPMREVHPRVIDYALSGSRSDFLDLWLLSKCMFSITTSTGLDSVADIFRKPIAFVNFLPLAWFQTWSECVLAPTHLVWEATGIKLTCPEHFAHSYLRTEDYRDAGILIRELSSEEILDVVAELELRLTEKWNSNVKMDKEQERFWDCFRRGAGKESGEVRDTFGTKPELFKRQRKPTIGVDRYYNPSAKFSAKFLEDNPSFLE